MHVYVYDIFDYWFNGSAGNKEDYLDLAVDLYDLYFKYWQEHKKWNK